MGNINIVGIVLLYFIGWLLGSTIQNIDIDMEQLNKKYADNVC